MDDKILAELKQIRGLLSELMGTSDLPAGKKFSKEAIAKAAKEFQKLSIERGEWLPNDEISKVIRNAPYRAGKYIIEQFGFTNYFRRGAGLYFNKKDLVALNKELKEKNINLHDYVELLEDQAKFQKYLASINLSKGNRKHYKIPEGLQDINTKPYSPPLEELVRDEIAKLMEEYAKFDLSEYISLYESKTYAYFKYNYSFDRYLKPELKKYCKDWCFKFNYANNALKMILELKAENNK